MFRKLALAAIAAATIGIGYAGSVETASAWHGGPHYRPYRPHYRPYFIAPRPYFGPRCHWEDRQVWTPYGWRFRPVRVCW